MKSDMGGLRKYMPITFWTFMVGSAALAGIPLFSGFWSKDEILAGTGGLGLSDGANGSYHIMLIMGLVTAAMTTACMTHCVYLTFFGEYRGGHEPDVDHAPAHGAPAHGAPVPMAVGAAVAHGHDAGHGAHDDHGAGHDAHGAHGAAHGHDDHGHGGLPRIRAPDSVPLIVLAVLSFLTTFANIPERFGFVPESWRLRFEHFVEPTGAYFVGDLTHAEFSPALALLSLVIGASAIAVAAWYYFKLVARQSPFATELANGPTRRFAPARAGYRVLENKFYLDWLYTDVIVAFCKGPLARMANRFNQQVLDGVVNGAATVSKGRPASSTTTSTRRWSTAWSMAPAGASETGGILRRIQTGRIQQTRPCCSPGPRCWPECWCSPSDGPRPGSVLSVPRWPLHRPLL